MKKIEALAITGKLEVRFHSKEQLLNEIKILQKFIVENDVDNLAISYGRLSELTKNFEIEASEDIQFLYDYIINFQKEQELAKAETEKKLNMSLEKLHLSVSAINCLKRVGINTVKDLLQKNKAELYKVRNLGNRAIEEIISKLKELGFELPEE